MHEYGKTKRFEKALCFGSLLQMIFTKQNPTNVSSMCHCLRMWETKNNSMKTNLKTFKSEPRTLYN